MRARLIAAGLLAAAVPASAQDTGWSYGATLYAWVPGLAYDIETPFGRIESGGSSSGTDILDLLAAAFMGTFEAQNGRWSLIGDLLYADLSQKEDSPLGALFNNAHVETKTTALSGYALYRAADEDRVKFDIGVGVRVFNVGLEVDLDAVDPDNDFSDDETKTWAMPLVAGRVILPFTEHWFATAFADVGAWQDDTTWQALATVGYNFNARWSAQIGYRHMELGKDFDNGKVELDLSGPMVGATLRF